ncbi:MAG: ATP-binding protein, partial [Phormidesmis sp.]
TSHGWISHGWISHGWTTAASLPVSFSVQSWAKWYLNGTYAFYACETASAFVAESKQPQRTIQSLLVVAGLMPVVYIVGSWLLLHLPRNATDPQDTFLTLLTAAEPYWGAATSLLVTFLIFSRCLLSFATAVSIAPRVLYQLAKDQQISPLFGRVSEQGVFGPGLCLVLILSLGFLAWGNLHQIVMVTGVGWLIAFVVLHMGLWFQRDRSDFQISKGLSWLSLVMAGLELFVLVVGGWAWGGLKLAAGLLLPLVVIGMIMLCDRLYRRWPTPLASLLNPPKSGPKESSFGKLIAIQVALLVGSTSVVTAISWQASKMVARASTDPTVNFLVVLILVMSFVGVAIACWTVFPQIAAINSARQKAEMLSTELESAIKQIRQTQMQMVQQEKLSSLGQLVAGIAHEINNPVSFIHGNLAHAKSYVQDLLELVELYRSSYPEATEEIETEIEAIDLDFLAADLPKILNSMTIGTHRIREIVLSLRNFSRKDEAPCKSVDVHEGLDSTLLILQHRLKAVSKRPKVEVIRDYGELPLVECYPSQLNQVFMNILANALDAMEETNQGRCYENIEASPNQVTIRTRIVKVAADEKADGEVGADGRWIEIAIADNGSGIPEEIRNRIFDPFFTTKPAGKGTGLGMSISYQIITQHHQGKLSCTSQPNQGTEFTIQIPPYLVKSPESSQERFQESHQKSPPESSGKKVPVSC